MNTTDIEPAAEAAAQPITAPARLRQAIDKLRAAASGATPGPWRASPVRSPHSHATSAVYSHAHPTGAAAAEVVASCRRDGGGVAAGGMRNAGDAVYVATVDPHVGLALADLMEQILTAHGADFTWQTLPALGPYLRDVVDAVLEEDTLWAVYTDGDSMWYPAVNRTEAELLARQFRTYDRKVRQRFGSDDGPYLRPHVVPWAYSAAAHRDGLQEV